MILSVFFVVFCLLSFVFNFILHVRVSSAYNNIYKNIVIQSPENIYISHDYSTFFWQKKMIKKVYILYVVNKRYPTCVDKACVWFDTSYIDLQNK